MSSDNNNDNDNESTLAGTTVNIGSNKDRTMKSSRSTTTTPSLSPLRTRPGNNPVQSMTKKTKELTKTYLTEEQAIPDHLKFVAEQGWNRAYPNLRATYIKDKPSTDGKRSCEGNSVIVLLPGG
jgi:hypothetical protein